MKTQLYHIMLSIQMQSQEQTFWRHWIKDLNMCAHAVIACYFEKLCKFNMEDYDISNETVKECLSHWYAMKLHRQTSHENDDMTTHKWPQFVPDDVKHDDIYVMNEYICISCRNSLRQKAKQKCLTRHVKIVYSCMTSHKIYRTYCHWREEWFLHESHS